MYRKSTPYDAIIILGSEPDTQSWKFPAHVIATLELAAAAYKSGEAPYIIVSGKWALSFDAQGIKQPYRECDEMTTHLIQLGMDSSAILREGESKDTISNLFYLKRQFLSPMKMHRLLFLTADFRLKRIQFLCTKILGPLYLVEFRIVPSLPGERYLHEQHTLDRTKHFLQAMHDGDDAFLEDKFYEAEFYK